VRPRPTIYSTGSDASALPNSILFRSGSYKELHEDKDDLSFFFLRGRETIQAFNDSLRWLTK
jgi:hypothetical protein